MPSFYIASFSVTIRLRKAHRFPFYHGAELYSLLCSVLGMHPLGAGVILYPCETGRIQYEADRKYSFGVLILNRELAAAFIDRVTNGFTGERTTGNRLYHIAELVRVTCLGTLTELPDAEIPNWGLLSLRFIAPLRLARKDPPKGKQFFDPDFFDPERFCTLLAERVQRLKDEFGWGINVPASSPADMDSGTRSLMWVDVPFSKTLGGVIGRVDISGDLSMEQFNLLRLGQLLGAGNNTSFGFGAYRISGHELPLPLASPAESFLDTAMRLPNMKEALRKIRENEGKDGYQYEKLSELEDDQLNQIARGVTNGSYLPGNLFGVLLPKGEQKIRALAIPPVNDRLIQRAVMQVIAPGIDLLLEECAYAFRKGRSRKTAMQAIRNAQAEGFHYVFEADIEAFFDNVDWDIMDGKLDALFHADPKLLTLLREWMKAPVWYNEKLIRRERGLPQGAVVSPVLANLFLDEFDEALQDDFRLIRYADDFVILCKNKQQAEDAFARVEKELADLKLTLKKSKTGITDFEEGFQYLGYLFLRSVVIEETAEEPQGAELSLSANSSDGIAVLSDGREVPKNSWVALLKPEHLKPVITVQPEPAKVKAAALAASRLATEKTPVYVTDTDASVRIEDGALLMSREDEDQTITLPLHSIESVTFFGLPRITMYAVSALAIRKIPVYFCKTNGEILYTFGSAKPDYMLWKRQEELSTNEPFRVQFARTLLIAKLENTRLTSLKYGARDKDTTELKRLADAVQKAESISSLRGIEGRGAVVFYTLMRGILGKEWNFEGRKKHPPPDPVNVLLSIGYTMLHNHIVTGLVQAGLNPDMGIYHVTTPGSYALASDLIEPYRAFIDGVVLYTINRAIIKPTDFVYKSGERYPCMIEPAAKKQFLAAVMQRLLSEHKNPETGAPETLLAEITGSGKQVLKLIRNPDSTLVFSRVRR